MIKGERYVANRERAHRHRIIVCLAVCAGARAGDGQVEKRDPDKYYILLDTKNEIVTVFERDETGQYTRIVRRFLCSSGRTDVDETDPEDEAVFNAARHMEDRGTGALLESLRISSLCALLGADRRQYLFPLGLFTKRLIDNMDRQAYSDMGDKRIPRLRAAVCRGRAVALLLRLLRVRRLRSAQRNRATGI